MQDLWYGCQGWLLYLCRLNLPQMTHVAMLCEWSAIILVLVFIVKIALAWPDCIGCRSGSCSDVVANTDTGSLDDFSSFKFWRIEPDVVDETSVVSACGDSLASLVICHDQSPLHANGDESPVHTDDDRLSVDADGDSVSVQHYHETCFLPTSNHSVKLCTYYSSFYYLHDHCIKLSSL